MIAGDDDRCRSLWQRFLCMLYVIVLGRKRLYGECGGLNRMDMYTGEFAYCTSNAQAKS